MYKTLLTILTALALLFGALGVTVVYAKPVQPDEPPYALRERNWQRLQNNAQPGSDFGTRNRDQDRIRDRVHLDSVDQLQMQLREQDRDRIHIQLGTGDGLQTRTQSRERDRVQQSQDDARFNNGPRTRSDRP